MSPISRWVRSQIELVLEALSLQLHLWSQVCKNISLQMTHYLVASTSYLSTKKANIPLLKVEMTTSVAFLDTLKVSWYTIVPVRTSRRPSRWMSDSLNRYKTWCKMNKKKSRTRYLRLSTKQQLKWPSWRNAGCVSLRKWHAKTMSSIWSKSRKSATTRNSPSSEVSSSSVCQTPTLRKKAKWSLCSSYRESFKNPNLRRM